MTLQIEFIWRFFPVPILALAALPGRLVGVCLGPMVLVRRDYLGDRPTIVHELTHCRQFWRGLALPHLLRYYFSLAYRLNAELEAFGAEIAACPVAERPARLMESARALSSSYGLNIDLGECCRLLTARVDEASDNGGQVGQGPIAMSGTRQVLRRPEGLRP